MSRAGKTVSTVKIKLTDTEFTFHPNLLPVAPPNPTTKTEKAVNRLRQELNTILDGFANAPWRHDGSLHHAPLNQQHFVHSQFLAEYYILLQKWLGKLSLTSSHPRCDCSQKGLTCGFGQTSSSAAAAATSKQCACFSNLRVSQQTGRIIRLCSPLCHQTENTLDDVKCGAAQISVWADLWNGMKRAQTLLSTIQTESDSLPPEIRPDFHSLRQSLSATTASDSSSSSAVPRAPAPAVGGRVHRQHVSSATPVELIEEKSSTGTAAAQQVTDSDSWNHEDHCQ